MDYSITLTKTDGHAVLINPDHIVSVTDHGDFGAVVSMDDGQRHEVSNTFEEFEEALESIANERNDDLLGGPFVHLPEEGSLDDLLHSRFACVGDIARAAAGVKALRAELQRLIRSADIDAFLPATTETPEA